MTKLKLFKTMDSCSMAKWSRQDSTSRFEYEENVSGAWFNVSILNNKRLNEVITGMIGVARFKCFSLSSLRQ